MGLDQSIHLSQSKQFIFVTASFKMIQFYSNFVSKLKRNSCNIMKSFIIHGYTFFYTWLTQILETKIFSCCFIYMHCISVAYHSIVSQVAPVLNIGHLHNKNVIYNLKILNLHFLTRLSEILRNNKWLYILYVPFTFSVHTSGTGNNYSL